MICEHSAPTFPTPPHARISPNGLEAFFQWCKTAKEKEFKKHYDHLRTQCAVIAQWLNRLEETEGGSLDSPGILPVTVFGEKRNPQGTYKKYRSQLNRVLKRMGINSEDTLKILSMKRKKKSNNS